MSARRVVIVGAGVAGLSCARALRESGWDAVVLERSRGVGGRCATRRVDGQSVDHGPPFLHGSSGAFLEALRSVEGATPIPGWPRRIVGAGSPCQPGTFSTLESRLAFVEGLSSFPKHLARGLDVRLEAPVAAVEVTAGEIALRTGEGTEWSAPTVVFALAVEQTAALLEPLAPSSRTLASACGVLRMVGSLPCLTVLAGFSADVPAPEWDVLYPEDSTVLHLVSHDSRKRPAGSSVVLVAQARPCWSRQNLDRPAEQWSGSILREAAQLVGEWVLAPRWRQAHRWKFARVDRGSELARPLLLEVSQGARIGVAGEMFAPGGGVQAAWESGRRLARRCIEEACA